MRRRCLVLCLILLTLTVWAKGSTEDSRDWLAASWLEVQQAAGGTRVAFYMWGGSAVINDWIDGYVASEVKSRFGIDLVRVPMDAAVFVNKLLTEKQAGKTEGVIDLLWINGENFKNAREAGLLYGPFAPKLPNVAGYVNPDTVAHDFGFPVDGYEAPYGRAQFVFEHDSARIVSAPSTFADLMEWAKAHPGRFTYPQPPDFTGSAFIRQVFYAVTGGHAQYLKGFDKELYERNVPRLWAYLNAVEPYLWQNGRSYPKDVAALDTLFERGEVDFNMSYHQAHAQNKIFAGQYPPTVRSFVMTDGSIFNTHFTAIPFNAPNKPGAMVVADFLVSIDAQHSKNLPDNWGDFTVLDLTRLPAEARARFEALDLGAATVPLERLGRYAVPEIPSVYLELLEQGWEENVLRK